MLTTFKVSNTLTLLLCAFCGGKVAQWTDKIYPIKTKFDETDDLI